jgi:hypothetical protein
LRSLFRDYIDRLRNSRKTRSRVIGEEYSDEIKVPLLAPIWTRAGFNGRLNDAVIKACNDQDNDPGYEGEKEENGGEEENRGEEDRNKEEEENEGEVVEETTVMITSEDNKISDSDLEMDE